MSSYNIITCTAPELAAGDFENQPEVADEVQELEDLGTLPSSSREVLNEASKV
jgi:hypothetical protein